MLWTVAQTVTWIAFGDAQPIANWGKFFAWSHDWPLNPPDPLLEPLHEIARGNSPPGSDLEITSRAELIIRETKLSPAKLMRALRSDLVRKAKFDAQINDTMRRLQLAVEQRLQIYAVLQGKGRLRRICVDLDLFIRFPMSIHLTGQIGPRRPGMRYVGPHFEEAAFEATDVRNMWPTRRKPPANCGKWMLKEARNCTSPDGRKAKRSDLVPRCVESTGCSHREASAAYSALPLKYRRIRGQRNPSPAR
jgi:hypothetical protein